MDLPNNIQKYWNDLNQKEKEDFWKDISKAVLKNKNTLYCSGCSNNINAKKQPHIKMKNGNFYHIICLYKKLKNDILDYQDDIIDDNDEIKERQKNNKANEKDIKKIERELKEIGKKFPKELVSEAL